MLYPSVIKSALSILFLCVASIQFGHAEQAPPAKPTDARQLELRLNQLADSLNKRIDALKEGNAVRDKQIEMMEKLVDKSVGTISIMVNFLLGGITIFIAILAFISWKGIKGLITEYKADLKKSAEDEMSKYQADLKKDAEVETSKYQADLKKDAEKAAKEYEDNLKRDVIVYDFFSKGNFEANNKKYDVAINMYNQVITLNPDIEEVYVNRGSAYDYLEKYDEAIADYNKAIELNPKFALAYNNRGNAFNKLKQYDNAFKDYITAIELNPKFALAYFNRGHTFSDLHQYDNAIKDYIKAIEFNPNFALASIDLSELLIITNKPQDALNCIKKGLVFNLSPADFLVLIYLKAIAERILDQPTVASENALSKVLTDYTGEIAFSFDKIESWLETAKLSPDVEQFIKAKTALAKSRRKK
jgi:tetratricopeptide (TPR) repeat protein